MSSGFDFVRMTGRELDGLSSNLEKRLPKAAQLVNIVGISLRGKFHEEYTFFRYNEYEDEVTCFLSQLITPNKTYWTILAPVCSDEKAAEILRSFCKLVNWNQKNLFNAVDNLIFQHLTDSCLSPHGLRPHPPGGGVYYMPKEIALNLDLSIPTGVTIRQLAENDMATVFSHWTYAHENPDMDLVLGAAVHLGSAGLEVNGMLVSWGISMRDGGIHAVHTLEPYRGHGYGKIVMRHICQRIVVESNQFPVVHIEGYNSASVRLMTSIGFQFSHSMTWTDFDPS